MSDNERTQMQYRLMLHRACIADRGYSMQAVFGDETVPPFCYTLGCSCRWSRPELLVVGLSPIQSGLLIAQIVERYYEQGRDLPLHHPISISLQPFIHAAEVWVRNCNAKQVQQKTVFLDRLGMGMASVRQIVWPDKAGRYPWYTGANSVLQKLQPTYCKIPVVGVSTHGELSLKAPPFISGYWH